MIVCAEPAFEHWRPPMEPTIGPAPEWTRLRCGGLELSNALNDVDWTEDRVQVELCEVCGTPGCASGGFVRVARIGDDVLWTAAPFDPRDDFEASRFGEHAALERRGAALFPAAAWGEVRRRVQRAPAIDVLPAATRRDVVAAWLLEPRPRFHVDDSQRMVRWLEARLVGCDTLDADEALTVVRAVLDWMQDAPSESVVGALRAPGDVGARIETLYFDGPSEEDWPALARLEDGWTSAVGRDRVLVLSGGEQMIR